MLLSDVPELAAHHAPDVAAIIFQDETITYAQLRDRCRRLANALIAVTQPGDRVAILAENCPEYVDCYYGVPGAGLALTLLNYRLAPRELAYIIGNAEPRILIVEAKYLPAIRQIRAQIPSVERILLIDGESEGTESYAAFRDSGAATLMAMMIAAKKPNQVAGVIPLSSTFFYDGWNISKFQQKVLLPIVLYSPLKYFLEWEEKSPYGIKCERTRALVHSILQNKDARTADKIGYFKTPATVILESFHLIRATEKIMKEVTCPLLIVHSTEDEMASIKNAYYVEKHVSSKHIETMYIDDTYHVVTLDKRKDDIGKRMAEFCYAIQGL